ncbi:S41 family peptidase [Singulisphaera acidiphila]|uniref:Tricorn protease homolog n=1 Tax=Singulisphaera acidiphila (strain ATCC BAA-1392 / DSM 18658 / VKM B-2454 / MOB10) TaxID=886293 RepID=L0DJU3_SINAD|nr:S41 family peptidase [Singulisphaera acidiphila]AGA28901.1 Tol biopolymer transport system, periplasmic component-related protein [Singulisphaera acidiphila DSM 18658]
MSRFGFLAFALSVGIAGSALGREAKLTRYPHYHEGKVAFSYLGDIWTAKEDGTEIVRLTANKSRDIFPRFSPDGKWIAFSSDREGGLDVYIIPVAGGDVKRLTVHSADDVVLNWNPDSKSILFASQRGEDFMGKLYTVSVDGGLARNAGPDMGTAGSYSPDGTRLAINRKTQPYWRKYYRGAYQSDVTVMDLALKSFKDLTDYDGVDSWPMWSQDGHIYFVSDRDDNAQTNLWRVSESGGEATRVTDFHEGDVRFPALSSDGKTIVFERDFGIVKLDLITKEVKPLKFTIAAETQESLTEFKSFNSTISDYDLAPDGERIVFAVRGEVFTAPTDEGGELRQITEGESRDQDVTYSPDGNWLAYVSDKSGREEIYVLSADGAGEAKQVTDLDALKSSYLWSPDSKSFAFTTADGKLYTITAEGKDLKELASSKYGRFSRPTWSPDGNWIAYSRPDVSRSSDIYLIPAKGGEEKKVTFDSANETNPRFSADAKSLYFLRVEGDDESGDRPSMQIFCTPLEKIEKDPEVTEAAAAKSNRANAPDANAEMRKAATARKTTPKEPNIDWAGLKRRTRQVTRLGSVSSFIPANDGKTLVFVASEGQGGRGGARAISTIQDDGKKLNRLSSSTPDTAEPEGDAPRGPRGSRGGGPGNLNLTRDGRTLYFQEGESVYSIPMSGGGGGGGGAAAGGGRSGGASPGGVSRKKVAFNVTVRIDKSKEWEEMFDDAWRTMKYRFYDPKMHSKDWDAMRAKYKPLVQYVGDRHELMNIINEMIGELNASHTGASVEGGSASGSIATRHLGLELDEDQAAGRYVVSYVYEEGPADKDWIKIEKGHYLIALDGKPLKAGDNYWERLGRRLNPKVELTVNTKPNDEGAWTIKYEPISLTTYGQLRYDRWVKGRRELVDKLSDGRVGYLHIKAMDPPSLARFKKELAEFRHKEGLVIDERWNGGGNIEQELLAILVQRPYEVWHPRGTEPTPRPFSGYYGPKVVLQNWRSASNAEMFPAGFRALGLGKLVGTQTMGAVIGTGSYQLIDGSSIRTPGVGVFLADEARTNMENTGVKPDVVVENSPEDNLSGHDRQLETAVQEVMKSLKGTNGVAGGE